MRHVGFLLFLLMLSVCPATASERVYVVAHDPTWPPLEYLNEKGELVGYSVDYINAVAKAADIKLRHVSAPWDSLFARLDDGHYDILASSVAITEERKKNMDFSEPYFATTQVLLLRADNAATSMTGMQRPVFGVQVGTTSQVAANKHQNVATKLYDDLADAIADLTDGAITGVVCDMPVAYYYIYMQKEYVGKIKLAPFTVSSEKEYYGFVVKKGNRTLLQKLNSGLAKVRQDNIAETLHRKWLSETFGAKQVTTP